MVGGGGGSAAGADVGWLGYLSCVLLGLQQRVWSL